MLADYSFWIFGLSISFGELLDPISDQVYGSGQRRKPSDQKALLRSSWDKYMVIGGESQGLFEIPTELNTVMEVGVGVFRKPLFDFIKDVGFFF
jgi:hypothetical protein